MDNISHDNLGVEDVEKVLQAGKKVVSAVQNRVKKNKATKIAREGNYWTLHKTSKELIPIPSYVEQQIAGKGITTEAVINLPEQKKNEPIANIIAALQLASGLQTPSTPVTSKEVKTAAQTAINKDASAAATAMSTNVKKYLPYILGAGVIGLIVYLISKK